MSHHEISSLVNELAEIQLELKADREVNKKQHELFLKEFQRLDEQD